MTALKIDANPNVPRLLVAGRKAAAVALLIEAHDRQRAVSGPSMDVYDGKCGLKINDIDIGPAIDAAVLEVMVQIQHPESRQRPPWWKFWA